MSAGAAQRAPGARRSSARYSSAGVVPTKGAPAKERSRHLHVAPRPAGSRRARLVLAAGVVVSVASLFLLVASNVLIVQGQFELVRLADSQEQEQRRYERLRLEVAERSAPSQVVSAAQQLGLVVPERIEYVVAPEAAPPGETGDRTASTLGQSWDQVKASLAAQP